MFARKPQRPVAASKARPREDARVGSVNPLALDPYSPILPARRPKRNALDPLALDPYGPMLRG